MPVMAFVAPGPEVTSTTPTSPVARARPSLAGDTISAELLITPDGMQAKDVSITGNVNIQHQYSSGTTVMPINLIGETMRLRRSAVSQGNGRDYLQLGSGPQSPARLTMGDGFFVGPMIKIWPSENAVQVEGAGELKIPTVLLSQKKDASDTLPTAPSTGSAALAKIDWTSPPHCHWSGGLQFDGQYAQVTGEIKINAELISNEQPWTIAMKGDAMEIALSNRIALTDRVSFASAQIEQVSLIQQGETPVVVQGEQFGRGSGPASQFIEARHLITAKSLVLNPNLGGELIASGPGWYRGWSMMDQKQSLLSNKAAKSENLGTQVLQGVHLTFRDAMRAEMAGESLTFAGGVRTGVRKLLSWEDAVDVNQMERLAVGEMTMDCSQLQFGITPGIPEHLRHAPGMSLPWQMAADGGVVLRTNTDTGMIEGTADRATFESQKSWLVISSSPRKNAFIRKRDPDGKVVFQSEVQGLTFNTKTAEAETTIDNAQLNDAPALLNRQKQRAGR